MELPKIYEIVNKFLQKKFNLTTESYNLEIEEKRNLLLNYLEKNKLVNSKNDYRYTYINNRLGKGINIDMIFHFYNILKIKNPDNDPTLIIEESVCFELHRVNPETCYWFYFFNKESILNIILNNKEVDERTKYLKELGLLIDDFETVLTLIINIKNGFEKIKKEYKKVAKLKIERCYDLVENYTMVEFYDYLTNINICITEFLNIELCK